MDVNQLINTVENKSLQSKKKSKPKNKVDNSFDNVMNSISQNWESEELSRLKKELEEANHRIKTLEEKDSSFTKNERKILSAIRSEEISQETESPVISYNKFRKVYKVSSNYYRPSIESLVRRGIIKQKRIAYSGKVSTFRWTISKQIDF